MIESPLDPEIVEEAKSEAMQQAILNILEDRSGPGTKDPEAQLRAVGLD